MSLKEGEYCFGYPNVSDKECCSQYIAFCREVKTPMDYPNFCIDRSNFGQYQSVSEETLAILDIVLSALILLISIFGKIEGTFKWCIGNIAIFHLFYPIFTHFLLGYWLYTYVGTNYKIWGWSRGAANVVINGVLTLGTQGITTSIAASLPLAINRYLLTHQSKIYEIFFGNKKRIVFWLFTYDLLTFGTFFTVYMCSQLSSWEIIGKFPSIYYNVITVSAVIISDLFSFILMGFVLYHIYSSLALVKQLDQKKLIQERKRIAWIIVFQTLINCILSLSRIVGFFNVSQSFANLPILECFGTIPMFYGVFSYVIQEFFVCLDGLLYIFFLTPYRLELLRFIKWVLRLNKTNKITIISQTPVNSTNKTK